VNTTARDIVRDYSARIEGAGIFFAPHIPTRRLKNAIRGFAPGVSESDVLVLVDGSFLGSGKAGGLLTEDTLHVCNLGEEPQRIPLADVDRIAIADNGKCLRVNDMDFLVIDLPDAGSRRLFAQMLRDVSLLQEGKRVVRTSVREIVEHHSTIVRAMHVFFAPHIPNRKLKNAIRSFAPGVSEDDVLVLVDGTASGSAKHGIVLTEDALYIRDRDLQERIALADIEKVTYLRRTGVLQVNSMKLGVLCRGQESMSRFARMMREIAALRTEVSVRSPLETPGQAPAFETTTSPDGPGGAVSSMEVPRIASFLRERLQETDYAYMAPDMPVETEATARASFRIPEHETLLALVPFAGSDKHGVAFTDGGMYMKRAFHEPAAVAYSELSACPYSRFRDMVPEDEGPQGNDAAALCRDVKTLVMYGDPNARPAPPDPGGNPHPVRAWFIFAGSFVLFMLLVPGVVGVEILAKAGYVHLAGWVALVSGLSWFAWFHSHRVVVRKKDRFAVSTVVKRTAVGVLASAGLAGAVLLDRHASAQNGVKLMEGAGVVAGSLAGVVVCMAVFFKVSHWIHGSRMASAVRRVASRYLENERVSGLTGLPGLLDAGVCELDDDAHVREVCRAVARESGDPLGPYRETLRDIDLMDFFEFARDRGYDLVRYGTPEELAREVRQGAWHQAG